MIHICNIGNVPIANLAVFSHNALLPISAVQIIPNGAFNSRVRQFWREEWMHLANFPKHIFREPSFQILSFHRHAPPDFFRFPSFGGFLRRASPTRIFPRHYVFYWWLEKKIFFDDYVCVCVDTDLLGATSRQIKKKSESRQSSTGSDRKPICEVGTSYVKVGL